MKRFGFTLAEVEICPPRGPILHEIKISAKGGAVRSEAETRGSEDNANESASESEQLIRVKQILKQAFTLAEVLITLAIIGVVAAISIPSVISNTQQQEFKTGLRKAVSVLNSVITMNMALDGESPYDNVDTFKYLQKHMSIMKTTTALPYKYKTRLSDGTRIEHSGTNIAFYTTDGMRFEMDDVTGAVMGPKLHESEVQVCPLGLYEEGNPSAVSCGGCGSYGLSNNPNGTTKPPCLMLVDVNGDRKPSPSNVNCTNDSCMENNFYTYPVPDSKTVTDIFAIMITEDRAVPFGVVAQRAMYQAQK